MIRHFLTLTDFSEVVYKVDAEHAPDAEGGIRWNDPAIGIPWPVADPILSERDDRLPALRDLGRQT